MRISLDAMADRSEFTTKANFEVKKSDEKIRTEIEKVDLRLSFFVDKNTLFIRMR